MNSLNRVLIQSALMANIVLTGCPSPPESIPADAGSGCAGSLSASEFNTWFEAGEASLNGAVKPANSLNFADRPNCNFYKWSEQMFLWLTSPAPPRYGGGGLVMNTPAFFDVSLPDPSGQRHFVPHTPGTVRAFNLRTAQRGILDLPIILEKNTMRMLEIIPPVVSSAGKQVVLDGDGNEVEVGGFRLDREKRPILLRADGKEIKAPRALLHSIRDKEIPLFERKLNGIDGFQRSELVQKFEFGKNIILIDLAGHFVEIGTGQADGGVVMAQNGSLVYYSITVNNVFALYRTMQGAEVTAGKKFPVSQVDLDRITLFGNAHGQPPLLDPEALAIEIKTSWVEAQGLENAKDFIQMPATVPTYDKSDPNEWVPNGTRTVALAMVGMHIAGSTGAFPENENHGHPEMLWATFEHLSNAPAAEYSYERGAGSPAGNIPQNTAGNWVFCANGATGPFNEMHMRMDLDHIVAIPPFTISPSNILRTMPWGLPGSSSIGNAEVISLNNAVRSLLDPEDIRRNYFHEGTTWTLHGRSTGVIGTGMLENATLETFSQGSSCLACHLPNTTKVSHVFEETGPLFE
jgi:hypothetical protein